MEKAEYSSIIKVLTSIRELLESARHEGQAEYVTELIALAERDQDAFRAGLITIDMWGGSGAVWDVLPFPSLDDQKRFYRLLVRLVQEMVINEIHDNRAEQIAAVLRNWLETDVWSHLEVPAEPPPVNRETRQNYIKRYLHTLRTGNLTDERNT